MKFAISFFSTLIIIIGAVLFVQYQVFSNEKDILSEDSPFAYSQEIEIAYKDGNFEIRQHFKNVSNQKVAIQLPQNATSFECYLETEHSCERLDVETTTFKAGDTRSQSIYYVVPVKSSLVKSELFTNIFAKLQYGDVVYSTVHISTDSSIEGTWVTSLPLIGKQNLSLVNYTMFSGQGDVKELYWDRQQLQKQTVGNQYTFYTKNALSAELLSNVKNTKLINDQHVVIVEGKENVANSILFANDFSEEKLVNNVLFAQLNKTYNFSGDTPNWMKLTVASFISDATISDEKALTIINVLKQKLSKSQLEKWENRLAELTSVEITPDLLDEELSLIIKKGTNYFEKNSETTAVYPFYYTDSRIVYVNGKKTDVDVVLYEGKVLYDAPSIFKQLGYKSYEGENGYYVNDKTKSFRFPDEKYDFYVFNQRRYNTPSHPLVHLNEDYFIEEAWLQRLFLVEVSKDEKSISITTMNTQK